MLKNIKLKINLLFRKVFYNKYIMSKIIENYLINLLYQHEKKIKKKMKDKYQYGWNLHDYEIEDRNESLHSINIDFRIEWEIIIITYTSHIKKKYFMSYEVIKFFEKIQTEVKQEKIDDKNIYEQQMLEIMVTGTAEKILKREKIKDEINGKLKKEGIKEYKNNF